jgi:hypothetical protein
MLRRTLLGGAILLPGSAYMLSCQSPVPIKRKLFDGKSLEGWLSEGGKPQEWGVRDGLLNNGPNGKVNNIYTAKTYGDLELWVEFRIPEKSNSGVYLQGLYEVQIFDSFGKESISTQDAGSIYHRWIDGKAVGGSVARQNASRAPGEWQEFHIRFRAPKFDAAGRKTQNARFEFVRFNGVLVQENVECEGPTRAHMEIPEAAKNPLMIQGDHGPVEFRRIDAIEL